jgi:hypothetical protein
VYVIDRSPDCNDGSQLFLYALLCSLFNTQQFTTTD